MQVSITALSVGLVMPPKYYSAFFRFGDAKNKSLTR